MPFGQVSVPGGLVRFPSGLGCRRLIPNSQQLTLPSVARRLRHMTLPAQHLRVVDRLRAPIGTGNHMVDMEPSG